jgi:ParB family chromosome partitioning protein
LSQWGSMEPEKTEGGEETMGSESFEVKKDEPGVIVPDAPEQQSASHEQTSDEETSEEEDSDEDDSAEDDVEPTSEFSVPANIGAPPMGRIDGFEPVHSPPKLNHGPPEMIYLDALEDGAQFRVRSEGEVALLATDIARLGQLFPIDVRPTGEGRYQVVCGFRRVAALKFLHREKVLARVHNELSDEDALVMSLVSLIHSSPVTKDELETARVRLEEQGRLSAATRDMLDKAINPEEGLAPEGVEEEVDADDLANDVMMRMADLNQDLALLADVFGSLDENLRAELMQQLRYASTLVEYLEKQ